MRSGCRASASCASATASTPRASRRRATVCAPRSPAVPCNHPDLWVVGTVGRLQRVKDQVTLARAFVRALAITPGAAARMRLAIVGDGPLRAEIEGILAQARVAHLAWLPGERTDVPAILRGLDCFVLPSRAEGISNTILEAMASGLPVIATRRRRQPRTGRRRGDRRAGAAGGSRGARARDRGVLPRPAARRRARARRTCARGAALQPRRHGPSLRRRFTGNCLRAPASLRSGRPTSCGRARAMCGIVGILDTRGRSAISRDLVARMNESQHHRGPDEGAMHVEPGLGLGHRRLSIIDLATGQQPLFNEDGSVVVVFNGEIYNYHELIAAAHRARPRLPHAERHRSHRSRLGGVGRATASSASAACSPSRSGTANRETLFLARDRLGVKPLFYCAAARTASSLFGSELKSLLVHPGLERSDRPVRGRGVLRARLHPRAADDLSRRR